MVFVSDSRLSRWLSNDRPTFDGLERRHSLRVPCKWAVTLKTPEAEVLTGTAVDVSPRGLQVQWNGNVSLTRGSTVEVGSSTQGGEPCHCQVRWVRRQGGRTLAGLAFENLDQLPRSWVHPLLLKAFPRRLEQRRYSLRIRCKLSGQVNAPGGSFPVTVRDLSIGGALLEGPQPLQEGCTVELVLGPWAPLPALTLVGQVQRLQKPKGTYLVGLRFEGGKVPRELLLNYVESLYRGR